MRRCLLSVLAVAILLFSSLAAPAHGLTEVEYISNVTTSFNQMMVVNHDYGDAADDYIQKNINETLYVSALTALWGQVDFEYRRTANMTAPERCQDIQTAYLKALIYYLASLEGTMNGIVYLNSTLMANASKYMTLATDGLNETKRLLDNFKFLPDSNPGTGGGTGSTDESDDWTWLYAGIAICAVAVVLAALILRSRGLKKGKKGKRRA